MANIKIQKMVSSVPTDLLPITDAENVNVTPTENIPITADTAAKVFEALDAVAFNGKASIAEASTSDSGLMSASDKTKLNGVADNATAVSVSQTQSSGTKLATVTVNGTGTDIYAPTIPASLPASDTTDTYSSTGTAPTSGKAVAAALGTLDVESVGGSGKYIQAISETDGKISATAADMPTSLPASNTVSAYSASGTDPINGTGVAAALGTLDVESVGGSGKYIQAISETDGKISATAADMPTSLPASDVYDWAKASTKPTYTASEVGAIDSTLKGATNGVAELDSTGKVPSSQLPSYVDDVIEIAAIKADYTEAYFDIEKTQVVTPESGKVYILTSDNTTYRWSSTVYAPIRGDLVLGNTSTTAFRGDHGETAYNHSQATHARTDATNTTYTQAETSGTELGTVTVNGTATKIYAPTIPSSLPASDVYDWAKASTKPTYTASEVGLGNVGNFKAVSTVANQGLDSTEQSNARANIGAGTSSLALGETDSTAYRGDRGKTAYDHSQAAHARTDATKVEASTVNGNIKIDGSESQVYVHPGSGTNPHGTTASDVGLGNVGNFKAVSTVASQGLSSTEQSNARANIGAGTSSLTLGNTSSTAYRGDYGETAYNHSQAAHARTDATKVEASETNGNVIINGVETNVYTHPSGTNPHGTTKSDVGLGNVGNFKAVSTVADQGLNSTEQANARANIGAGTSSLTLGNESGTAYRGDYGETAYNHSQAAHARTDATKVEASSTNGNIKINGAETTVYTHPSGTNPHGTTASDVGLGNVGNFKAVSTAANQGLSSTEQSNARANIGAGTSSLTLGTGSGNAYYGDKGKTAYDHSQATHARTDATKVEASTTNGNVVIDGTETTVYTHPSGTNPHGTTKSDVGLGNVGNFKAVSTVASQGLSSTEQSNARANIGAGTSSLTLGETETTAYRGDRGATAYDHSQATHARTDATNTTFTQKQTSGTELGTVTVNGTGTKIYAPTIPSSLPASDVSDWAKASTKPSYTASEVGAIASTLKGAVNGVAELDSSGKVPSSQLPSFVDDVIEGYYYNSKFYKESSHTTEITGESGKIYVDLHTDKTYRWGGTAYAEISSSLALGETSSTAYRGDRGKTAYDHSQAAHARTDATNTTFTQKQTSGTELGTITVDGTGTKIYAPTIPSSLPASDVYAWAKESTKPSYTASEVGLGNVGNFKAVSTVASQGLSSTEQANARANIGAGTGSSNLELGETSSTAYRGDRGKTAYDHSQATHAPTTSATAASGGTTLSLVTTGEKYTWNNKSSLELGETSSTAYRGDRGKTAYDHSQAAHAPSNAEANQNAFSNITVGTTTVAADSATDTVTFEGSNITITPDATNDKITFSAGSAATKDVPSSGNASSSQVVMGNDTRLTDARNAADVYSWAKASTKPSYSASEVGALATSATVIHYGSTSDTGYVNDTSITANAKV